MQPTAQQKHDILIHCESRLPNLSEVEVARLHGVIVNRATIWNWKQKWNRTPQSLEHKKGAGRPHILTPAEISRHIRAPILAANRAHRAIHYSDLLASVQSKTRKKITLRTIQRTGQKELGIRERITRKRTSQESKCIHIQGVE